MVSKEEWEKIKRELSKPYGVVFLRCDGYLVYALVTVNKMTLKICIYVNNKLSGEDVWVGKKSQLDLRTDIAKRFYCISRKNVSAADQKLNNIVFGKKIATQKGLNEAMCMALPYFRSAGTFIQHLKKNNVEIEVLDFEAYETALELLEGKVDGDTSSHG